MSESDEEQLRQYLAAEQRRKFYRELAAIVMVIAIWAGMAWLILF
jgi:CHASE3 domain sensor protein